MIIPKFIGNLAKSNIKPIFVKQIVNVNITMDIVEITNCFDGLLVINGIFVVRIIWIINVCEIIPNANQPVWNNIAFSIVLNFITNHKL